MYRLHIAIADLLPPDPDDVGGLPRLPMLERLLTRATMTPGPADWRAFALERLGAAVGGPSPALAALLAARHGLPVGGRTWFVLTPVHLVAGLTTVHHHVGGPVVLNAQTVGTLVSGLNAAFGEPGIEFHAAGAVLLVAIDGDLHVRTVDPWLLAGRELSEGVAVGGDARRLARLMGECELWLHQANLCGRDGRAVHALHPWADGPSPVVPGSRSPRLLSADPLLEAALGPEIDSAAAFDVWSVADLLAGGAGFADADRLWVEPLQARLRDGEITAAEICVAGRLYAVTSWQRFRWLRRVRPWWELLA